MNKNLRTSLIQFCISSALMALVLLPFGTQPIGAGTVPAEPTISHFMVVPGDQQVMLSWKASSKATGYNVKQGISL